MKWIKKVATTPLEAIAKVVDTLQSQTNDRTNAPSIRAVREAINQNWLTIYPIGSIYMCVNDINPSEVFGGTWVQIKDRFLLAAGDTYNNGATGGSATHTLTPEEMGNHVHNYATTDGGSYIDPTAMSNAGLLSQTDQGYIIPSTSTHNIQTSLPLSNEAPYNPVSTFTPLDKMPPYLAVKVWKRTA